MLVPGDLGAKSFSSSVYLVLYLCKQDNVLRDSAFGRTP